MSIPAIKLLEPTSANDLFQIVNNQQSQQVDKPWWDNTPVNTFDILSSFAQVVYEQNPTGEEKTFSAGYNRIYLQYPHEDLQALSDKITYGLSDNDDKATAIIRWVLQNFPYQEDIDNYGYDEFWAPPIFALQRGRGDCEDGAFLVHSLMLHAGISYDRIRTYGGYVDAGPGAASGGHAWTAYRRELDDEWVVLDSSYFPTLDHVKDRPLMKGQSMYVDNFFYFNQLYWVNLEGIDRIHNPGIIYSAKAAMENKLALAGRLINAYA